MNNDNHTPAESKKLTAENIAEEAERTYQLYALAGIQSKKDFTNGFEIGYQEAAAALQERVRELEYWKDYGDKLAEQLQERVKVLTEERDWWKYFYKDAELVNRLKKRVEELEKQLSDHKIANFWDHFQAEHKEKIEAQSRIAELEKENKGLRTAGMQLVSVHETNKKLMGLLKEFFMSEGLNREEFDVTEEDWQSYCQEHNLIREKTKENE